jgi:hypothetical protein
MVGCREHVTVPEVEPGREDTPFDEDSMAYDYQLVGCVRRGDGFDNI